LQRLSRLASSAFKLVAQVDPTGWNRLFVPSERDFNVVIRYSSSARILAPVAAAANAPELTASQRKIFKKEVPQVVYKNDSRHMSLSKYLLVNFSPLRKFVETLEDRLGSLAFICANLQPVDDSSCCLGLIWNPFTTGSIEKFQLNRSLYLVPATSTFRIEKKAIIDEIRDLGRGFVTEIEIQNL